MKKYIYILLIGSILTSVNTNAQTNNPESIFYETKKDEETAGRHLRSAATNMYVGMGVTMLACVPLFLDDFEKETKDHYGRVQDTNTRRLNYVASGGLAIVAIAFYVVGIDQIRLAGKKLDMQMSNNSIGLAIKF